MHLDTHFWFRKFPGKMNGETIDSWIQPLSTYLNTLPEMSKDTKLRISGLRLEGIAQAWWDSKLEQCELVIELSETTTTTRNARITSWD